MSPGNGQVKTTCSAPVWKGIKDMKRAAFLNRIVSVLVLVCFIVVTLGIPVMAGEKIELKKKFFGGWKYQQGSDERKPIYGFTGMSFKSEFENALAAHPPALAEAKKAFVFNGMGFLFSLGMLAFATVNLLDTIDEAKNPGTSSTDFNLAPLLGCAAGVVVSGLLGISKVKSGVRMYNENAGTLSAIPDTAQSPAVSTTGSSIIGFKAGLNMANQDLPNPFHKSITRLAFGGFMTFPVAKDISVQTEVLYSMKGCKVEMTEGTFKYKLDYLDFPILLKYTFPTSGSTKPFVFAGPSLGILLRAVGEVPVSGGGNKSGSIKTLYNSTDFGIVIGGGINFGGNVSIDGRYAFGQSNLANSKWPAGVSIRNSALSFMVGYAF